MISRSGGGNFFVEHYDWIAAAVGLAALIGSVCVIFFGPSADEAIAEVLSDVSSAGRGAAGAKVEAVDMARYADATNVAQQTRRYESVTAKAAALFTSDLRIACTNCAKATPQKTDEYGGSVCAFCGLPIEGEKKVEVDKTLVSWEKKYGLKTDDSDADGDDFTNAEEYEAKTDPKDRESHPDYLADLRLQLPLRATFMPFVFIAANKIPAGWRCSFFDAKQKDDYGRAGKVLTALIGEEIGKSGFVLKAYEAKEATRQISGGKGMTKRVDVSEVTVVRKKDGREIKLVLAANKRVKPMTVDAQATLVYERRGTKTFEVLPGAEIALSGRKYRVLEITSFEKEKKKGARVVVQDVVTGVKTLRDALEQ